MGKDLSFTSAAFIGTLQGDGITISMAGYLLLQYLHFLDPGGAWAGLRYGCLWRSVKYVKTYASKDTAQWVS